MQLLINNALQTIAPEWREDTLLHVLREHLGLVGSKYGCGLGQCGACTVLLDGRPQRACQLAVADLSPQQHISTIEGLAAADGPLHPVQQAWLDERVPQCGFCQAGQIVCTVALLRQHPRPSEAQILAALDGQLCRCGTQQRIRRAVQRAAELMAAPGSGT